MDGYIIDCQDLIARAKAGNGRRRFGRDMPGYDARRVIDPGNPVVRRCKKRSLLEIDNAEDNSREGGQRKYRRSQPNSKTVVKPGAQRLFSQAAGETISEHSSFQII